MTADPSAFDRLVLAAVGAPTAAPETAGDLAALMVEVEQDFAGLMREHLGPGYVSDFYRNEAEPFVAACLYYVNLALRGEA